MDKKRIQAASEALEHTSYGEMAEHYDRLEAEARRENVGDPQDLAEAQFFMEYGFHLEEAFTVYMVECARTGEIPSLPEPWGTRIYLSA